MSTKTGRLELRGHKKLGAALEAVLTAGALLSNVAYNAVQDDDVPEQWRKHLHFRRLAWDEAITAYREARKPQRSKSR